MSKTYRQHGNKAYMQKIPIKNAVISADEHYDKMWEEVSKDSRKKSPEVLFEDASYDIVLDGVSYTVKGKRIKNGIK